jgi:LysM repeat protein
MNLPTFRFPKLKRGRKKLRATATRRRVGIPDAMDFEEMGEPNMKLSRALLIVLLLHIVAVAGIIAFNAMKSRQGNLPAPVATSPAAKPAASPNASAQPFVSKDDPKVKGALKATAVKDEHKPAAEPPKYYTVAKGDNPLTISKKFKVPFDDLLAANHIDDPHKLQVGQKLIIPQKAKPKKTDG